ncbi:MAG: capsular biosynthesis protein [Muribaculaceae bacterium]|nr:capsular biosynthesis protein [Muribaculaceae bacterium]
MWPFKKRVDSLRQGGIMQGFTDWHSHILPGVDDGVPDMETSLATLEAYDKLGVKRVWLTPHIMEDYPNTPDDLRKRFAELKAAWTGNVELHLAAENMLDSLFMERLEARDLLPIGSEGNHLLVETSYYNPPMDFDDMIDAVQSAGYHVVLAHPERYRYMNEADYKDLRRRGVLFQVNMMSTLGMYGETARGKAEWMLREGMVELTGTDLHRLEATARRLDESPKHRETLEQLLKVAASPGVE